MTTKEKIRECIECKKDISDRNGNAKRCNDCRHIMYYEYMKGYNKYRKTISLEKAQEKIIGSIDSKINAPSKREVYLCKKHYFEVEDK